MNPLTYQVYDDEGFMGIVDLDAFDSTLDSDWEVEQVGEAFMRANARLQLIFWGTGREDTWQVRITFTPYAGASFRTFESLIRSSNGRLQLACYGDLTMAAEYPDEKLTLPIHKDTRVDVPKGLYRCRVIQRFDPEPYDPELRDEDADFVIELTQVDDTVNEQVGTVHWAKEFETPETPAVPLAPKTPPAKPVGRLQSILNRFRDPKK